MAAEQRLDPGRAAQQYGVGVLGGLEQVVAAFEVGLVAVGGQDVGVGERGVVGDQRVMPSAA